MHLNKISIKIKKYQWLGLYNYLFGINSEVTAALNTRMAHLEQSKYVLYDICQQETNTTVYHRWMSRQDDKYYTMHLPVGQAVVLVQACFDVQWRENPALHAFISSLYPRLTEYVSPHQFTMTVLKESNIKLVK